MNTDASYVYMMPCHSCPTGMPHRKKMRVLDPVGKALAMVAW